LQITQTNNNIYSALKFLGISKSEIDTYITLLSLGEADLYMMCEIMKRRPEIIYNILKTLKQRKWISITDQVYSPINPSTVIKREINNFRNDFKKHINTIKSEALECLKTIFVQNNLMNLENVDFDYIIF